MAGRTGRMGNKGVVVTIAEKTEKNRWDALGFRV
jgi:superfamily II DNA/RNA helicase